MRIYKKEGDQYVMLWPEDTGATSETYLNFLRQFLPEFHKFLLAEGLLDDSYFHLSDEPGSDQHVENYRKARKVLRELAPWMKVMDALSDIRYGKEGLTDIPIPIVELGPGVHRREDPALGLLLLLPAGPVAQPLHGHAADEGAHVRLAVLPPRGRRVPALGLQLLAARSASRNRSTRSTTAPAANGRASPTATRS